MNKPATHQSNERARVLAEAVAGAADKLGVSMSTLESTIGRTRTSITRYGIVPDSKPGELSLLLVRVYRSLFALMGGDEDNMQHFMQSENHMIGGAPIEQITTVQGLVRVCDFLDALRGRA